MTTDEDLMKMPSTVFLRQCMEKLKFMTDSGDFDMVRAARYWGIRYELFVSLASGDTPLLKRDREKIKKKMDLSLGLRSIRKRDAKTAGDLQNERVGRYLRKLRERLFLVGIEGVSKNQAQIAALLDVSIGAVQAWEYGRTRIPDARLGQYLRVVGADTAQARKAWAMLGIMPEEIQIVLAGENPEAEKLWDELVGCCERLVGSSVVEVTPQPRGE
jgi:hypothetical protein